MKRRLNIVAHHDDDLLFLSPNLLFDIQKAHDNPNITVQTVFLIASDYTNDNRLNRPDYDPIIYMKCREEGVRSVYSSAYYNYYLNFNSFEPDVWWTLDIFSGSTKQATIYKLAVKKQEPIVAPQVSIIELRIPDRHLMNIWENPSNQVITEPGEKNVAQEFTKASLTQFITDIITRFAPTEIHTLNPYPEPDWDTHPDHVATGLFVDNALKLLNMPYKPPFGSSAPVTYYIDYQLKNEDVNLSPYETAFKERFWDRFIAYDYDAKIDLSNGMYSKCMRRMYTVSPKWPNNSGN